MTRRRVEKVLANFSSTLQQQTIMNYRAIMYHHTEKSLCKPKLVVFRSLIDFVESVILHEAREGPATIKVVREDVKGCAFQTAACILG